ncbi:MAG: DUF2953 domain-containing protein [Bacillaceae bacterium]|nr:DUF2953 domain-containing protein [Bacillaceae bacterium]
MKLWLVVVLLLFWLLWLIFMTTLKIKIEMKREGHNDLIHIEVRAWMGLIRFRQDIPAIKLLDLMKGPVVERSVESPVTDKKVMKRRQRIPRKVINKNMKKIKQILKHTVHIHRILKLFFKKIKVDELKWHTSIGTGDAAETGLLSGIIWSVKGALVGVVSQYFSLRTVPRLHVSPSYQSPSLSVQFSCIVRFRVGHAMVAGIRIWINFRKGRERKWQNILFRA